MSQLFSLSALMLLMLPFWMAFAITLAPLEPKLQCERSRRERYFKPMPSFVISAAQPFPSMLLPERSSAVRRGKPCLCGPEILVTASTEPREAHPAVAMSWLARRNSLRWVRHEWKPTPSSAARIIMPSSIKTPGTSPVRSITASPLHHSCSTWRCIVPVWSFRRAKQIWRALPCVYAPIM